MDGPLWSKDDEAADHEVPIMERARTRSPCPCRRCGLSSTSETDNGHARSDSIGEKYSREKVPQGGEVAEDDCAFAAPCNMLPVFEWLFRKVIGPEHSNGVEILLSSGTSPGGERNIWKTALWIPSHSFVGGGSGPGVADDERSGKS